jgi:hypothetical protein
MLELYPEAKNEIEDVMNVQGYSIMGVQPHMVEEFLNADKLLLENSTKV